MRRKIFLLHMLTLILSMAVLLAVNGLVTDLTFRHFRDRAAAASGEQLDRCRSLLDNWSGEDWESLSGDLRPLGYALLVERGDQVVYSSLDGGQADLCRRMDRPEDWPEGGSLAVDSEGMLLVGRRSGDLSLTAVRHFQAPELLGRPRRQSEAVVLSLVITGLAATGVLILLGFLITRWQVGRIMQPVTALAEAARRVEAGDLTWAIDYQGRDEFTAVCAAFDQMQAHLLAERERLAAYERARTELVAGISHDLRTPLTSVKGYIQGLRDGVAQTPERQRQYIDIAYRRACDMDVLLRRLFYFSRLETGNLPLFLERADLGEFAARFAGETGAELEQTGARIRLTAAPGPHPVSIDPEQLYRVLNNLKDNALRYAGAEPLVLSLSVERRGSWECIRFADNGRGVAEEALPHLFEQFWRADQARSARNGEGAGLGLYIARYIVEAHDGTIRAENSGGLVFTIQLPGEEGEHEQDPDRGGRP